MKKKKLIVFLIAIVMGIVVAAGVLGYYFTTDIDNTKNLQYSEITVKNETTGTKELVAYYVKGLGKTSGLRIKVDIPSTYKDKPVTTIGPEAFKECGELTSITIPDSVTTICHRAFFFCYKLKGITISDSVTRIDSQAFMGCKGLTSIEVASGNTAYHSNGNCLIERETKTLILGCNNSVLPTDGSLWNIGDNAFYNCNDLKSVTIPNSVTTIGEYAFHGCRGLTSITISNGVTIGNGAFNNCDGLKDINFSGTKWQWNAIKKGDNWDNYTGNYTIHCTDGDITK